MELWSTLEHKNVLELIEKIVDDEVCIFVTPCYPINIAEAFRIYRKENYLFDLMCGWVKDVFDAVGYFHSRGLCHLDLKDNNVLTYDDKAIVCDFTSLRECNGKTDR